MKKTRKILIIAFLLCVYIFYCKINSIPNKIIVYGDEKIKFFTSKDIQNEKLQKNKETLVDVKLFNTFSVKQVSVNLIDRATVIPIGQVSGLKLYTNGVLVVGMSEIKGEDNNKYKPYENSGIEEGDRIVKINDKEIADTKELINMVNSSKGKEIEIEYVRENESKKCKIKPIKYVDGSYKLGLWVRDSSAGIGTMTFYEPSTGSFAALGHGITDNDTGSLVEIKNGDFLTTKILSVVKGKKRNTTEKYREL